jgi:hypothetical protein
MKENELDQKLDTLSERELDILKDGISYHAVQILLRVWPDSQLLKDLLDQKRY